MTFIAKLLPPPSSGSTLKPEFYSWNMSELSEKGAAGEIVWQFLEVLIGKLSEWSGTLPWKVFKVRPLADTQKLI